MHQHTLILSTLLLTGCATCPQFKSIEQAATDQRFAGLDGQTRFSIAFPGAHADPYRAVDQLNFTIENGRYQGSPASALLVKSQTTGNWNVSRILIEQDGRWIQLLESEKQ